MVLAHALPREIARVAELVGFYCTLPGPGPQLTVNVARSEIAAACDAIGNGDVVEQLRLYQELQKWQS